MKRKTGFLVAGALLAFAVHGWTDPIPFQYEVLNATNIAGNLWVSLATSDDGRIGLSYNSGSAIYIRERGTNDTWGPLSSGPSWPAQMSPRQGAIFYNVGAYAGLPGIICRDYVTNAWGVKAGVLGYVTNRTASQAMQWAAAKGLYTNSDTSPFYGMAAIKAVVGGVPTAFVAVDGTVPASGWLYSSTNGTTWTSERIDDKNQSPFAFRLGADNSGVVAVFKSNQANRIYIRAKTTNGWQSSIQIDASGYSQDYGGFDVLRVGGTNYVAYQRRTVTRSTNNPLGVTAIKLARVVGSSVTTQTIATISNTWTTSYMGHNGLRLAIDSNLNVFIASRTFYNADATASTNDQFHLYFNIGGTWQKQTIDTDIGPLYFDMVLRQQGPVDRLYIAWNDALGTNETAKIAGETNDMGLYMATASFSAMGDPQIMVKVPGADGFGVNEDFWIQSGEVTVSNYVGFLNSAEGDSQLSIQNGEVKRATTGERYCLTTIANTNTYVAYNSGASLGQRFSAVTGKADHPMVHVSWFGAAAYCNWKSTAHGWTAAYDPANDWAVTTNGYRLPTEAQWYKAAGWNPERGICYNYGTVKDNLSTAEANYLNSGDDGENNAIRTRPVMSYRVCSYYGLHDASGNVWEWCHNFYDAGTNAAVDPHALRGGSWANLPGQLKTGARIGNAPDAVRNSVGFRMICTQQP